MTANLSSVLQISLLKAYESNGDLGNKSNGFFLALGASSSYSTTFGSFLAASFFFGYYFFFSATFFYCFGFSAALGSAALVSTAFPAANSGTNSF